MRHANRHSLSATEIANFFNQASEGIRYTILLHDGGHTLFYHGMFNRGKGLKKTPIFLPTMENLGLVYPHTYKGKGWAMTMLNRCKKELERRSPFGLNCLSIAEIYKNPKTGKVQLGREIKF